MNKDYKFELYNGDSLEIMEKLIQKGIMFDSIITDPPYQTTACDWDNIIPFNKYIEIKMGKKIKKIEKNEYILQELEKNRNYKEIIQEFEIKSNEGMWDKLLKLIKPKGSIVLFGSHPFSSKLISSCIDLFRYEIIWNKVKPTNFQMMNFQPGRIHENIMIFSKNPAVYSKNNHMNYYPILEKIEKTRKASKKFYGTENKSTLRGKTNMIGLDKKYNTKHPRSIIEFSNASNKNKIHPTQKPIELMKYLVKTFSKENDLILDFTCGSGSTGIAANQLKRNFIGIDNGYCKKEKIINNENMKNKSWIEITKFRLENNII